MKPFLCRVGNKYPVRDLILDNFSNEYDTYVEPFAGSASIYFSKAPVKYEVINDLDTGLINLYKILKKGRPSYLSIEDIQKLYEDFKKLKVGEKSDGRHFINAINFLQGWVDKKYRKDWMKLVKGLIKSCSTYMGKGKGKIHKDNNPFSKLLLWDEYSKRMKNTKIHNWDYKRVMKKI